MSDDYGCNVNIIRVNKVTLHTVPNSSCRQSIDLEFDAYEIRRSLVRLALK